LAFAEEVLDLGMPRRALGELDLEVDELEIAVEDDQRELLELALVAADRDPIVIDAAVDLALAEHDPALRVPRERRRPGGLDLPPPHLDAGASAARQVLVPEVDRLDHAIIAGEVDHAGARALPEHVAHLGMKLLVVAERDLEVEQLEVALLD